MTPSRGYTTTLHQAGNTIARSYTTPSRERAFVIYLLKGGTFKGPLNGYYTVTWFEGSED